jgi:hypothetical protein
VNHSGTYKTIGNTDARRMVVGLLIGISGGDFSSSALPGFLAS